MQPYFRSSPGSSSAVSVGGATVHLTTPAKAAQPAVSKQASAFPPNYIHSLDASHMMMTADACARHGIAFAGVHDSFWTHAADVDTIRREIREQFVALYSQPLLEQLRADMQLSLEEAGSDAVLPPPPATGELDLKCVLDSTYFFN